MTQISQSIQRHLEQMSEYMKWYQTNSKVCLAIQQQLQPRRFTSNSHVVDTSRANPGMTTKQRPFHHNTPPP